MQRTAEQGGLEMSLREALASQSTAGTAPPPYPPAAAPHPQHEQHHDQQQHPQHPYPPSEGSPRGQQQHHHLDPNVTGQQMPYAMGSDEQMEDGMSPNAQKGKRELSTSKRAAQNRAAQRAFRQRKEGYIKKLEEQVKDFGNLEQNYKALQNENYQLREYILNLQSRLLENQSDFPPAPSHINLHAVPHAPGADGTYAAEQQLRREMEQRHEMEQHHDLEQRRPPPAPIVAGEDPVGHDGISQLQAAAAQERAYPGGDPYARPRSHPEEGGSGSSGAGGGDAKPAS